MLLGGKFVRSLIFTGNPAISGAGYCHILESGFGNSQFYFFLLMSQSMSEWMFSPILVML
jgi:hypothetical protein